MIPGILILRDRDIPRGETHVAPGLVAFPAYPATLIVGLVTGTRNTFEHEPMWYVCILVHHLSDTLEFSSPIPNGWARRAS